jgi:hypothetical protein
METHYTWKTKMFSRKFDIYQYENLTGELKKEGLSRKTYGELGEKKIFFETKGFFKNETQILNQSDSSLIGTISYNFWKSRSQVSYNNKEYSWQFDNFWRTKWSLSNKNGYLVRYNVKGFKGTIDSYTDDTVLVLAGFFIRNYFRQRHAQSAAAS